MATTELTQDEILEHTEPKEMTLLGVGLGFAGVVLIAKEKLFLGALSLIGGALIGLGSQPNARQRIAEVFQPEKASESSPSATVKPAAVKPATAKPAAVKPAAVKPAAVKPAAVKPAAVKPAAAKPAAAKRTAAKKPTAKKPASKPAAAKKSAARKATAGAELKKIEGIGPKIAEVLAAAGIQDFTRLAESTPERLREVLAAAGTRYRFADPSSWPEQAALAAAERWDDLSALQGELKGGRRTN